MKKIILFLFVCVTIVSCNSSQNISDVLSEHKVGQEVVTSGKVYHVCHCTGLRCIIANAKMQCIEAEWKDKTKKFSQALMGKTIKVSGVLKTKKLTRSRVLEMIEHAKEHNSEIKIKEGKRILSEMNKAEKNMYTTYFVECTAFELE